MRLEAGLGVSRFYELAGIPRPTWYRRARKAPGAWRHAGRGRRRSGTGSSSPPHSWRNSSGNILIQGRSSAAMYAASPTWEAGLVGVEDSA
jgi:hypothetical protein